MKNVNPLGLFDEHFRLERLTQLNDPLVKLNKYIDWRIFAPVLNQHEILQKGTNSSHGGRPAFNTTMMFKALILQSIYNISDEQLEYQINDRRSFMRFLGLNNSDKVPDSRTFWVFREALIKEGLIERLFEIFNTTLDEQGVFANTGKILDATFVEAPRQRNKKEENDTIKQGKVPEEWKEKPRKLCQKDLDARWTQKNKTNFYGYKNHVKADEGTKLIVSYIVTSASVHDSQPIDQLLDEKDEGQKLYADSAYTGKKCEKIYHKKKVVSKVVERKYRNLPLTKKQKDNNKEKSSHRARVEHIFGFVENSMNGSFIRTIGLVRAKAKITLMNLTYNLCRCVQLKTMVSVG